MKLPKWSASQRIFEAYIGMSMYNVRFSKQIFLALPMGHQENKICPSKASEVYRPVWCSISAHIDHFVATLHHLPKDFL